MGTISYHAVIGTRYLVGALVHVCAVSCFRIIFILGYRLYIRQAMLLCSRKEDAPPWSCTWKYMFFDVVHQLVGNIRLCVCVFFSHINSVIGSGVFACFIAVGSI